MLPVKVGDVLEFDPLSVPKDGGSSSPTKTEGRSLTTCRVVDVNPEEEGGDNTCTVQVSPYEPLQPLDLKKTFYKVVYEAGELRSLSSGMVGWELELESVDTKRLETGVVKQVDCDINCAMVLFAGGRKEWLDLTFFRVKVPGHQVTPKEVSSNSVGNDSSISPTHKQKQHAAWESPKNHNSKCEVFNTTDNGEDSVSKSFSVAVSPLKMPRIDPDQFDWHLEGTHVELCDRDGQFLEGAALCSKTNSHLQLYNERREFFEISCSVQSFKVVIHGLESLKTFPMGQIIDVYSPLIGRFRSGTALKAAVFGCLTPVRFATNKNVEWIDLKSQTFKLVFLPHTKNAFEHMSDSHHRVHGHDSHRSQNLEYPHLHEGQGIEIFDEQSKQYQKYIVASQSNWSKEAYVFEPAENFMGGASSRSTKHITSPLSKLRSRLLLLPAQWVDYRQILVGHRVDAYDRVAKSVMNGKIHAVSSSDDEPSVLVRFKDGTQVWLDLRTDKVKMRMHPTTAQVTEATNEALSAPLATSLSGISMPPSALGSVESTTAIPAVHPTTCTTELAPSKSNQALFRIPSGEAPENLESSLPKSDKQPTEAEIPAAGGSPERKPSPGKRMPALHRRASQSADVPKTQQPGEVGSSYSGEMPELPTSSPIKDETPVAPAVSPAKPLSAIQSPRLGDPMRPVSPGGPLPPVQAGSNPNSPSKTILPVGPVQAAREPNLGLVASDHEHAAT